MNLVHLQFIHNSNCYRRHQYICKACTGSSVVLIQILQKSMLKDMKIYNVSCFRHIDLSMHYISSSIYSIIIKIQLKYPCILVHTSLDDLQIVFLGQHMGIRCVFATLQNFVDFECFQLHVVHLLCFQYEQDSFSIQFRTSLPLFCVAIFFLPHYRIVQTKLTNDE